MPNFKDTQPYFVYKRITLALQKELFLFKIFQGFNYLVRDMIVQYPEIDNTGLIFGPYLRFKWTQRAQDVHPMDHPIPFRLVTSPASAGSQINVAGEMTAASIKNQKTLNVLYPEKDIIYIEITGQNGVTPEIIDIVLKGYLIPKE